jgi:protein-S-isoprenylcysteine O-methyltransferase Ste14
MESVSPHQLTVTLVVFMVIIRVYYWGVANAAAGRDSVRNEGAPLFLARMLVALPAFVLLITFLYTPDALPWSKVELPEWAVFAGAALGVVSLLLLSWVHRHLGRNFSTTLHIREDHTLITTGPYRYVRHPMYAAFILWATSFFLLSGEPVLTGFFMISFLIVMIVRTPREEAQLVSVFGNEYREYIRRTGRFLPRLKPSND